MSVNFEEQFARMEMDIAWDNYLDNCYVMGITPFTFELWKKTYNK